MANLNYIIAIPVAPHAMIYRCGWSQKFFKMQLDICALVILICCFDFRYSSIKMATATVSENQCDPCLSMNDVVEATKWCMNCNEKLCVRCATVHKAMKLSSQHQVISLFDQTNEDRIINELEIDEFCKKHRGKLVEMVCKDHGKPCYTPV